MPAFPFVSSTSANALISDLRPTTLAPPALAFVNALLDELLVSIVTGARSLNPAHLRTRGVPAVFSAERDTLEGLSTQSTWSQTQSGAPSPASSGTGTAAAVAAAAASGSGGRDSPASTAAPLPQAHLHTSLGALGRAAVGEAEVEIRSWYEGHEGARQAGFPPNGRGRGLTTDRDESDFPVREAVELMRAKVATFSTFAPEAPPKAALHQISDMWKAAGGDLAEETVCPAGLWLTAVLEHVCEHVLSKLSQVVARDSAVTSASVQDLYTALCEDDSVYGFFKRMEVKKQLEMVIRATTRPRRVVGGRSPSGTHGPSAARASPVDSPHGSLSSLSSSHPSHRDDTAHGHIKQGSSSTLNGRPQSEQFYKSVIGVGKSSSAANASHKRASSILSVSTRQASTPLADDVDAKGKRWSTDRAQEEDFDAFIRSGETMRVSLTPSRFSTFENSPSTSPRRAAHDTSRDHLSAPPPMSSSESSLLSSSTTASTADSRAPTHRQMAGRSWNSATKLLPRGATIEEKAEEEDFGQSVMELLKAETRGVLQAPGGAGANPNPTVERTVPAVVLGTTADGQPVSPVSPISPMSQYAHRATSLTVPVSDDVSGLARANRSASDGAHDESSGTFRGHRAERAEMRANARELAEFLSTTAPPPGPTRRTSHASTSSLDQDGPAHGSGRKMPRFLNIMRMGSMSNKRHTATSSGPHSGMPVARETRADRVSSTSVQSSKSLRVGTPSETNSGNAQLRSQRSASSFTSGSTLQPHVHASTDEVAAPAQPRPESVASTAPVKTREVLRKPSLVRKWAAQVSTGESRRRTASTPQSISTPTLQGEEESLVSPTLSAATRSPHVGASVKASSTRSGSPRLSLVGLDSPRLAARPLESPRGVGLGLGDDFPFGPIAEGDAEPTVSTDKDGTLEAALAALTAGSRKSSPVARTYAERGDGERSDTRSVDARSVALSVAPSVTPSTRSDPRRPRHDRVEELAREGADDEPASIPLPPSPSPGSIPASLPAVSPAASVTTTVPRAGTPGDTAQPSPSASAVPSVSGSVPASATYATATSAFFSIPSITSEPPSSARSGATPVPTYPTAAAPAQIPLADLVPLRHLLDHATSPRECQLLLDAILTQLGVPSESGTVRPEDRVAAWLLAGGHGPVGDMAAATTANGSWSAGSTPARPSMPSQASSPSILSHAPSQNRHTHSPSTSSAGSSRKRAVSKRLSPELIMKSLPALPSGQPSPLVERTNASDVDIETDEHLNGNGNGDGKTRLNGTAIAAAGDVDAQLTEAERAARAIENMLAEDRRAHAETRTASNSPVSTSSPRLANEHLANRI